MPHETINNILVIDDTPDKLELTALMLRKAGYKVSTALDAREGLKRARLHPPDLIISDVSMPGMDGIEFCRRVRADEKLHTVPIILVSSLLQDTESVLAGLQAGADDYLEVPFDLMRLIAKVARLIERKRMEDAVRDREKYYRTLIENASDLISILNADGSMRYQSPSLGRLLGYKPEELIDKSVIDFIHPEDKKEASKALSQSLLSLGDPVEVELRFKHKDGSWHYFVSTLTNLLDDPIIEGIVSNAFDITERKRAEEALRQSEEQYRSIVETTNEGIWIIDNNSCTTYVNQQMAAMLGYTVTEMLGRPLLDFIFEEDYSKSEQKIAERFQGIHESDEFLMRRKDGSAIVILYNASPVKNQAGETVGLLSMNIDITERKQSELALKESEAELKESQRLAQLGNWYFELNSGAVRWSAELFRIYGRDPGLGAPSYSVHAKMLTPESLVELETAVRNTIEQNVPWKIELEIIRPDQSRRWILSHGEPMLDATTSVIALRGTALDITERKQAQKDLLVREAAKRRLAERQTAILNALPANICLIGSDGIILDVNIKWREFALKNYFEESNSCIGDNYLEVCDTASGESVKGAKEAAQGIRAVIAGKSMRFELDYPCHSLDEQRWFKLMVAPIHEDPSEGVVIMHVNITEGVLAKIALSDMTLELEAAVLAYRQVLGKSLDVICTMDKEGRFVQVSAAAKDVWGYQPEELLGRRYIELVHPDDRDRTILAATAIMAGTATSDFDNRYLRKDGSVVDIMWSANWSEADGAMFCVARDVSQIKQAERALEQSAEQLRQAQKLESVGRLAGGIAHDFNNMLTTIQGYSDLTLRRLESDDPLRSNIEEIKKAGERSAALTRQLLAFSRQQILQPVVLDLNKVIIDTVTMLHRLIGEDIQLVTLFNPKAGRVKVDPGQLTQIIMNLAVNARDAMPQGGKLTIETANVILGPDYASQHIEVLSGDYVMLAMSDDGIGMSAATQKHIFDPFFTTKEIGKGTGLGLATVYGIVKQSGGDIWVYSEEGIGTTFKVYLPQVAEPTEETKAEDSSEDMSRGTETILMVEDEEMVRTLTCRILEDCGYTVIEAHNGVEAISLCEKSDCQIDLLMTDVVMPQMGGRELAERVAQIYPRMQILYTSGYTDDAVVRHGVVEAGMNFIQKPFTPQGLALKVREVLDLVVLQ